MRFFLKKSQFFSLSCILSDKNQVLFRKDIIKGVSVILN